MTTLGNGESNKSPDKYSAEILELCTESDCKQSTRYFEEGSNSSFNQAYAMGPK